MKAQHWWFTLGATRARARVTFNHALRSQVTLDTVTNSEHIAVILYPDETDPST